jgi:hypothetical protein
MMIYNPNEWPTDAEGPPLSTIETVVFWTITLVLWLVGTASLVLLLLWLFG